jgi:hypothetical protein
VETGSNGDRNDRRGSGHDDHDEEDEEEDDDHDELMTKKMTMKTTEWGAIRQGRWGPQVYYYFSCSLVFIPTN